MPSRYTVVGFWGLMAVPLTNDGTSFVGQLVGAGNDLRLVSVSASWWLVIKAIMGIRVSEEEWEYEGTDIGECGLEAYPEFTGTRGSGRRQTPCLVAGAPFNGAFSLGRRLASNDRRFFDQPGGVIAVPSCSASRCCSSNVV